MNILDKNHVFSINSIRELLKNTTELMEKAILVSRSLDIEIKTAANILSKIPVTAAYGQVLKTISEAYGKLEKNEFHECLGKLKKILNKLINEIPQYDNSSADILRDITDLANKIENVAKNYENLINSRTIDVNPNLFLQELKRVQLSNKKILSNVDKKLNEIKCNLKGLEQKSVIYSKDPVNLATGNFVFQSEDLIIDGFYPLVFKRVYNSVNERKGALGRDWSHNFEISLDIKDDSIKVNLEDGIEINYIKNKDDSYSSIVPIGYKLEKFKWGYKLSNIEGTVYRFSLSGNVLDKNDKHNNKILFKYEKRRLSSVTNKSGTFTFNYENNHLASVEDNKGRKVKFIYNGDNLIEVINVLGNKFKYEYDSDGKVSALINPADLKTVENKFDDNSRTIYQKFPDGGSMTYDYKDNENAVVITERNGNKIKYVHDNLFRNTKVIYDDSEECYEYNNFNEKTSYKDRMGNVYKYNYDLKGKLISSEDPLGNKFEYIYDLKSNDPIEVKLNNISLYKNSYDNAGNLVSHKDSLNRERKIKYNEKGNAEKIIKEDNSEIDIFYDEKENIREIINEHGESTKYEYDDLNRVIKTTNALGNSVQYEYDDANKITKVINEEGSFRLYDYNSLGLVTSITDFDGNKISCEYNALSKPMKVMDKMGNETRYEYDSMWNVKKKIHPNGLVIEYKYDKYNNLIEVNKNNKPSNKYEYDKNGNVTCVIDSLGNKIHYKYDSINRKTHIIDSKGNCTKYDYDILGRIKEKIDPENNKEVYEYNDGGEVTKIIDAAGNETSYTYNELGLVTSVKKASCNPTLYSYYKGGHLKTITTPKGEEITFQYNKAGNISRRISSIGKVMNYYYDKLGRLIEVETEGRGKKLYEYDLCGNVTKYTDENNNSTYFKYTANGQIKMVIDPLGAVTNYKYDSIGNLIERERCDDSLKSEKTIYNRDLNGNIISEVDPLGNKVTYEYDDNNNVIKMKDKDGFETKYTYNSYNKVENILYEDGRSVKLKYNALAQLVQVEDFLGRTKIKPDPLGQPLEITDYNNKTVSYKWGASGERTSITYPDGSEVLYEYDDRMELKSIRYKDEIVNYNYDDNGFLKTKEFSNGVKTLYSYDNAGNLESLINKDKEAELDKFKFKYDNVGNKIQVEKFRRDAASENGVFNYSYDSLNRITSIKKGNELYKEFEYDIFGNRTVEKDNEKIISYEYNEFNQLIKRDDGISEEYFTYDRRGNLIDYIRDGVKKCTYVYDSTNTLVKADNIGQQIEYKYNGLRRRTGYRVKKDNVIQKDVNYIIDMSKLYNNLIGIEENNKTNNYVFDDELILGTNNNDNTFMYLNDFLGSNIRRINVNSNETLIKGYDEFGNSLYDNLEEDNFGFTGYIKDVYGDLYYAQGRNYSDYLGRFVNEDPYEGYQDINEKINRYSYALNNPLRFVDSIGFTTTEEGKIAHRELQAYFLTLYPDKPSNPVYGKVEYYINKYIPWNKSDTGRADIVLFNNGIAEVYEIKPGSNTQTGGGIAQLEGYISALKKSQVPAVKGTTFNPNRLDLPYPPDPNKVIRYYTYPDKPGMIYYDIVNKPKKEEPVTVPVPNTSDENSSCKDKVILGLEVAGGTYIAYRIIRMIPSLLCPPTIPANLAIP